MTINMNIKPEDIFRERMIYVLDKIKTGSLSTLKNQPIIFRKPNVVGVGIPSFDTQKQMLLKLQEENAIKLLKGIDETYYIEGTQVVELELDKRFDQVYKKYKNNDMVNIIDAPSIDVITADLESKFQEIEGEKSEGQFFLKVANYGRYLLNNDVIHPLFKPLFDQSEKDLENYKKACDDFYEVWRPLAKDLIEKAEMADIKDNLIHPLQNQLSVLKVKLDEKPDYNDNYISQYYIPYWRLTIRFQDLGKKDLIFKKHFIKTGEFEYLKIDSFKKNAEDEWTKFKNIRQSQVWWAYYQIMRLTHGIFDLKEKDPYYSNDHIIDSFYRSEFEDIAKGGKGILQFLRKARFGGWIRRLHKYLIPRLEELRISKKPVVVEQKIVSPTPESFKLKFYPNDGVAVYRGVDYQLTGKYKAFLTLLNDNKNTPFSVEDIKNGCNGKIIKHAVQYFQKYKDIRDTYAYIKKCLKVNKGEYFPIEMIEGIWNWIDR